MPARRSDEQAALFALDCFRRAVLAKIEMLDVRAIDGGAKVLSGPEGRFHS